MIIPSSVVTLQREGTLTAAAGLASFRAPFAGKVTGVTVAVLTAPVGASLIVDVNKGGTTLYTTQANRPTIAAGTSSATASLPDVTEFAAGDVITVDVDQIGSGTAGAGLTVAISYTGVDG
jgi:hypothetical protein